MRKNCLGIYGPWAANLLGDKPGKLSLRNGTFRDVNRWRSQARQRVRECLAAPTVGRTPKARVDGRGVFDGVRWERLSWQLPWGPRTEAVLLRPADADPRERLPGILGLHDHGGNKYYGWQKIARVEAKIHPLLERHHERSYSGTPWANQAAKRGYAVLVHDTFPFASRRIRVADVTPDIAGQGVDPQSAGSAKDIQAYNAWAATHESTVAKSLLCAGTTWAGVYVAEDEAALSVLCGRADVDETRIACGGLSGGGMRSTYLAGLDDRIHCSFTVGFSTTWRDFLLHKSWTHTWMAYAPLLPADLDFPEILALRAPLPALVLNTNQDQLYTLAEMKRAGAIMREVYRRAKAPEAVKVSFHPGPHEFNTAMQVEAFAWVERWLGRVSRAAL